MFTFLSVALSIVTFVGFYGLFAYYQIRNFHPTVDTSEFIQDFVSSIRPENEIFLYQAGWILFFLCVPVLFVFYNKLLIVIPSSIQRQACQIFLWIVGSIFLLVSLFVTIGLFEGQFEEILVRGFVNYSHSYLDRLPAIEIGLTAGILIMLYIVGRYERKILVRTIPAHKIRILFIACIILIIFWAVTLLGFPKGYLYNYVAMVAPLNDVLGGKTLLANSYSHYGLLMIYALVPIFKFIKLSFENMVYIVSASYILFYTLIFLIMIGWFRDKLLALFALYFILLEHYFAVEGTVLCCANISFLRFGWWVILSAWILWKKNFKIAPSLKHILEFFLVATAVFWSFDTGMYILLAYLAYLFVSIWSEYLSFKKLLKSFFVRIVCLVGVLLIFFGGISVFLYQEAGKFPNWSRFYGQVGGYVNGLDLLPLPRFGPYQAFIAILVISVGYIFYRLYVDTVERTRENARDVSLFTFLTFYALFSLTYYLGRSAGGSIHTLLIPFVLIACWLILKSSRFYRRHGGISYLPASSAYAIGSFSILCIMVISIIITAGNRNLYNKYQVKNKIMEFPKIDDEPNFHASLEAIQKELEGIPVGTRRITIISTYDILYHVKSQSVNVLNLNDLVSVRYTQQLKDLGNQLLKEKPPVVFAEHNISSTLVHSLIYDYLIKLYKNTGRVGNLDRWELIQQS